MGGGKGEKGLKLARVGRGRTESMCGGDGWEDKGRREETTTINHKMFVGRARNAENTIRGNSCRSAARDHEPRTHTLVFIIVIVTTALLLCIRKHFARALYIMY